ncbi:photosystem II q(b) protein [Nodosilinea sp. LEGE 07298]|uniref:photosystem II q(b) protein n=1 Tax=Nodosilinea sp. LEGE 07298 TaxID=2777970 RepID=UPI00187F9E32|nr:photosystem II q(b) protein [Nodosilinea sp. LEGE 07298]MBE9111997.1 photosystem II q(b) protein [Nodosilinea sp. LEGE 07298]
MITQLGRATAINRPGQLEVSEPNQAVGARLRGRRVNRWERFCQWVTSTENRIYIGWFGVLMIPTMATAAVVFVLAFIAAPAVDLDGTGRAISGALLDGNNLITGAVVPTSAAIGLHFYPIWDAASLQEWLVNGGPYQLIVLHFLIGIIAYQDREWELSYRLGMRPWISLAFTAPVAAAVSVLLIYPVGQGSFSSGMPLGISGTFTFMLQFQADHNILANPFHQLGVIGVFGGSLLCAAHGSLVTSAVIRQGVGEASALENSPSGWKKPAWAARPHQTYSFDHAQANQEKLLWRGMRFKDSRSLHFFLAAFPVAGIWSAAMGVDMAAFGFDRFSGWSAEGYLQKTVVPTWADITTQANLGIRAMKSSPADPFPLWLDAVSETSLETDDIPQDSPGQVCSPDWETVC